MRSSPLVLCLALLMPACLRGAEPLGTEALAVHRVCGTDTSVRGIDVSSYEGTINWPAVARGGARFAIMRHSYHTTLDTTFAADWAGAHAAGLIRGAYQFFNPFGDATAQANFLVDGLLAAGWGPGDLPPIVDIEQAAASGGPALPSHAAYTALVRTWLGVVQTRMGVRAIIYTGGYYWDDNLATNEFSQYPLWHAQYPNSPALDQLLETAPLGGCPSSLSNGWTNWAFWQFAGDNGRAPGITGEVDINMFNGSFEDLQRLARVPSVADAGVDASSTPDARAGDVTSADATAADALASDGADVALPDSSPAPDAAATDVTNVDASAPEASADAGPEAGGDASREGGVGTTAMAGCGCRAPGPSRGGTASALSLALAASMLRRRRRR